MNSVTTTTGDAEAPHDRGPIEVNPEWVCKDSQGFGYSNYMVRLPKGAIFADLSDPTIWSKVQKAKSVSLSRHDHLYLVDFDEAWAAEAIVTQATDLGVTIALRGGRIDMLARSTQMLPQTELYRQEWRGNGHYIIRKADQMVMGGPFASRMQAERFMDNLYSRPRPG